ncbi:MAG: hypothetical protein AB7O59_03365 [Pirellulales bacterium]
MDGTPKTARRWSAPCVVVMSVLLAHGLHARAQDDAARPAEPRVARLIRDLGAGDYATREKANRELAGLGAATRADLERALGDSDLEVRLRAKRLLDALKTDDLWRPSLVEYPAQGVPASKVLAALAAASGNHIHIGDPYGSFADKALNGPIGPSCYWQAVDAICEQSGNRLRPHYDMHTPGIVVSAGAPPRYPHAYSGPVRAQITQARRVFIEELNYEEHQAELTHSFQINLQFTWEDRFAIVGYATQPTLVEAVTDNHVVCSSAQTSGGGWNATTRGLRQVTASLKLNPVPISATKFKVFTIRWGLIAVGEPTVLEVDDFNPERTHAQDDVAMQVVSVDKQPGGKYAVVLNVTRDLAMPDPQEAVFQEYDVDVLDAQGRKLRVQNQAASLSDRGVQLKLTLLGDSPDSEAKRLRLHYPRLRARRELELTFTDVPLPTDKPE